MPQEVHDFASIIQIALFALAAFAYIFRGRLLARLRQFFQIGQLDAEDVPALTATQIRATVLDGFGDVLNATAIQDEIIAHLETSQCLRRKEDREARLHHDLDWERFFEKAAPSLWTRCAVGVAHPLQGLGISRVVVLPWPRSNGNPAYEGFTRALVEALPGSDSIVVDHVKDSEIRDGLPLQSFAAAERQSVVIFEPFEVADGHLEKVAEHLRTMYGCDIKALVTFFKTNRRERQIAKEQSMLEIQMVKFSLAEEEA